MCCGEQGVCRQKNAGVIWNLRFFVAVGGDKGCGCRLLPAVQDTYRRIAEFGIKPGCVTEI